MDILSNYIYYVNNYLLNTKKRKRNMTLDDAVTYYKHNYSNLARALGMTKQHISKWKKLDYIPYHYQCQLEVMTKGALKADQKDP